MFIHCGNEGIISMETCQAISIEISPLFFALTLSRSITNTSIPANLGNYIVHSLDFGLSLAFAARLFLRALRFAAFVFIFGL